MHLSVPPLAVTLCSMPYAPPVEIWPEADDMRPNAAINKMVAILIVDTP